MIGGVGRDNFGGGVDVGGGLVREADLLSGERAGEGEGDLLEAAPPGRHPGEGRDEAELAIPGDKGDLGALGGEESAELVGGGQPAEGAADDDDAHGAH